MNINLIVCFLILVGAVKINADSSSIQVTEVTEVTKVTQDIVTYSIPQEVVKLPWSDCTEVNKLFEKKISFSKEQIKKENEIYKEYRKFSLKHNNLNNFSMQFVEKENENTKAEMLIKFFLSILETNKGVRTPASPVIRFKEQEFLFKRGIEEQITYRKKYDNNTLSPYIK